MSLIKIKVTRDYAELLRRLDDGVILCNDLLGIKFVRNLMQISGAPVGYSVEHGSWHSPDISDENFVEVMQAYLISERDAEYLMENTNEIVFKLVNMTPPLESVYVWGITHWGTSWSYVPVEITEYSYEPEG